MDEASHVRVSRPLEPFALGFRRELAFRGYTPGSAAQQLKLVERLSLWLADRQLDVRGITPEQIEQFVGARRAEGYRHWISPQALAPLLDYLCSLDALAAQPAAVLSPMEEILERYTKFMVSERALAAETVRRYLHTARKFLETRENQGHLDLRSKESCGSFFQNFRFVNRHKPDVDPEGIELHGLGVKRQGGKKQGDVSFGECDFPTTEPVRKVRGLEPASAGPMNVRSVGKGDENPGES